MTPEEIFCGTKIGTDILCRSHVWGCPTYVLDPKLQDGKKIPKWRPRSRRGQFLGFSPMHANTVGLIRNLETGFISPQFHCVYDDWFETVHSYEDLDPEKWKDLVIRGRVRVPTDDGEQHMELADDWLTDVERTAKQQRLENLRQRFQGNRGGKTETQEGKRQETPTQTQRQGAQLEQTATELDDVITDLFSDNEEEKVENAPPTPPEAPTTSGSSSPIQAPTGRTTRSRSGRQIRPPDRYGYDGDEGYGYNVYETLSAFIASLPRWISHNDSATVNFAEVHALLADLHQNDAYSGLDAIHPMIGSSNLSAFATKGTDPDTPTYEQAMASDQREEFEKAMEKEIADLSRRGTFTLIKRSDLPSGANLLPGTWAFKVKRFPDGRIRKYKARFCVRGDRQVEGIDYDKTYAPVVQWSTVRLLMTLSVALGLKTKQVDFDLAFAQAELDEDIFLELPKGFVADDDGQEGAYVMKLNRSLYGLKQAALYWFQHLSDGLKRHGFKPANEIDPCLFIHEDMIVLVYVDDCLFFGRDEKKIQEMIQRLKDDGFELTEEHQCMPSSELMSRKMSDGRRLLLSQPGLIKKILRTTGMDMCAAKATPATQQPLGTNPKGNSRVESWSYALVIGMLLYVASNTRPDIQFAVHQCVRFTHTPKRSHEEAVKRICRYLKGTMDKGMIIDPKGSMKLNCYVDADFAGLWLGTRSVEKSVSAHTCQTVRWADVVAISSKTPGNRHEMEGQQPSILVK